MLACGRACALVYFAFSVVYVCFYFPLVVFQILNCIQIFFRQCILTGRSLHVDNILQTNKVSPPSVNFLIKFDLIVLNKQTNWVKCLWWQWCCNERKISTYLVKYAQWFGLVCFGMCKQWFRNTHTHRERAHHHCCWWMLTYAPIRYPNMYTRIASNSRCLCRTLTERANLPQVVSMCECVYAAYRNETYDTFSQLKRILWIKTEQLTLHSIQSVIECSHQRTALLPCSCAFCCLKTNQTHFVTIERVNFDGKIQWLVPCIRHMAPFLCQYCKNTCFLSAAISLIFRLLDCCDWNGIRFWIDNCKSDSISTRYDIKLISSIWHD